MILNEYKKSCFYFLTFYVRTIKTAYLYLISFIRTVPGTESPE